MPFDLLDVPARIHSYRDAGYDSADAKRLAKIDMQDAASDVLSKDMANPVSVEILELEPIPSTSGATDSYIDKFETATELDAVIGACRDHGMGMSDDHYRLASAIQNSLHGRFIGERVMVKMESVHALGYSDKELILHFEDGVGQTLKNIWAKVRNGFINTFNNIRTWYVKAFDATQRLGNKAKAIRTQAEGKQGTINQTSFQMGGMKFLAMNRRPPEPNVLATTIGAMSQISSDLLGVSAEHYNKLTEKMTDILKELIGEVEKTIPDKPEAGEIGQAPTGNNPQPTANQPADYTFEGKNALLSKLVENITALKASYGKIMQEWPEAAQDERFKDNAANAPVDYFKSNNLPGDSMIVVSIPKAESVNSSKSLNELRNSFGGTVEKVNPKQAELDDSGNFKTLSTSQVQAICDSVMTACKAGLDYKLLFNERDKAFKNLGTQLDRTVNEADKLKNQALTFVKGNVTATTSIFGKINSIEGRWLKYSMAVYTKAIDYCQASLNQTT